MFNLSDFSRIAGDSDDEDYSTSEVPQVYDTNKYTVEGEVISEHVNITRTRQHRANTHTSKPRKHAHHHTTTTTPPHKPHHHTNHQTASASPLHIRTLHHAPHRDRTHLTTYIPKIPN
jgi:hypothetical protein